MKSNHQIKWGRPTYRTVPSKTPGAAPIVFAEEPIYTSKCGRFKITGHMMAGRRNGTHTQREWRTWRVVDTGEDQRIGTSDSFVDAKMWAEYEINPNWEPAE